MSKISSEECYRRLGLKVDASWPDVKSAFRRMARRYHPDVSSGIDPVMFEMISEAYMTLRDSMKNGSFPHNSGSGGRKSQRDLSWMKKTYTAARAWVYDVAGGVSKKRKRKREEKDRLREERERRRSSAVESIIYDAEVHLDGIVSRVGRSGALSERERFFIRLESRLPEVRNLAINRLVTSLNSPEVAQSLENSFSLYGIDEAGLDSILSVTRDIMTDLRFARSIAPHFREMSMGGAKKYIRWISQISGANVIYGQLEYHPSPEVMGFLFARWPVTLDLPPVEKIVDLLQKNEEAVLVSLLRLISKKGCPVPLLSIISNIYRKTESPSVKAWSGAIVCKSTVV